MAEARAASAVGPLRTHDAFLLASVFMRRQAFCLQASYSPRPKLRARYVTREAQQQQR